MSRTPDLSSIDAVVETETITFDYGRSLGAGVIINSAVVSCGATKAIDTSPTSRLIGALQIITSPASGELKQAVVQLVGTCIAGEVYRLGCIATTSDGQLLEVWSHLTAVNPN